MVAKASLLIYASTNGDQWLLARDTSGKAIVRHVPNSASGGEPNHIELDAFLSRDRGSPQRENLLRLIGTLVPHETLPPAELPISRIDPTGRV